MQLLTATWGSVSIDAAAQTHPNEMSFQGVLLRLDEASTKPPNGARGHKILIPEKVAAKRMHTLIGMGVNLSKDQGGHNPQRKVGVINKAWIKGKELWVKGTIWKKDFPDAKEALESKKLGMSFEGSDVQIEDQHSPVWKVADLFFTGAALLLKTAAAYAKTEALAASASKGMYAKLYKGSGGTVMAKGNVTSVGDANIEALTKALMAAIAPLAQAIQAQTAAVTGMQASIESLQDRELEVQARKRKQQDDGDDGDGDGDGDDDDEEDDETDASADAQAQGDDEEDVDACAVCGGKGCTKCMKGGSISDNADDGEELEELLDKPKDQNNDPGHLNPDADIKNKGSKTSVTTKASASNQKLRSLLREVIAERDDLQAQIGRLTKKVKGMEVSASRIAEKTTRRSVATMAAAGNNSSGNINATPLLKGLLAKNSVDISIAASGEGEGLSWEQFNKMLDAANLETAQRLALKIEAERLGVIAGTVA